MTRVMIRFSANKKFRSFRKALMSFASTVLVLRVIMMSGSTISVKEKVTP
jgi:hypothetical protein